LKSCSLVEALVDPALGVEVSIDVRLSIIDARNDVLQDFLLEVERILGHARSLAAV
jgi:hypothetical protein